ncbi:MAG: hypothetical protein GF308_15540 [Candidatus Heimdallarchaeota archaeon]|nr:hypothetical protein [Candidatus Heimdallarchaeota archaeon]
MGTIFFTIILLIVRKIKDDFFSQILEVERYSDLICREISLILSVTNSLSLVIEFIAHGNYPIVSFEFRELLKELNLGASPDNLLKAFAKDQPSETIREFLLDYVFPLTRGEIKPSTNFRFDAQWRIRSTFDSYLSQIEGKMSLFLSLTTIVPVTISMLLIIFGYISVDLLFFLPFIFFILGIIALEILNAGKIKLLGGDDSGIEN